MAECAQVGLPRDLMSLGLISYVPPDDKRNYYDDDGQHRVGARCAYKRDETGRDAGAFECAR